MDLARKHNMVPEETYSEKGKTAEDIILRQEITYNLARQWKWLLIIVLVNTTQCYDRVTHAMTMTALTLRSRGSTHKTSKQIYLVRNHSSCLYHILQYFTIIFHLRGISKFSIFGW